MSENTENKGRLAPQIIEAEAAVLGCILINPDAMAQSMQILDIDDFYNQAHSIIYQNMLILFEKLEPFLETT